MGAVEDALEAANAQLSKAKGEITDLITTLNGHIADLETQIAANAVQPETLQALKDTAQALDDVVPDVVSPPADTGTPTDTTLPAGGDAAPPADTTGDGGFTEPVDVNPV